MFFLDQSFQAWRASAEQMDALWAQGWRHFGTYFFRYRLAWHGGQLCSVLPLRLDLTRFALTRSQRRIWSRNRDLSVAIRPTIIDDDKEQLFYRHRARFKENQPDSLYDFLSERPATVPCRNEEISLYLADRLIATSFLDIGQHSTSAVYAMFEPAEARRSLGIFTMLRAIKYSQELGYRYYYPGYAYEQSSIYDYKKNFIGLEALDWDYGWAPFSAAAPRLSQLG